MQHYIDKLKDKDNDAFRKFLMSIILTLNYRNPITFKRAIDPFHTTGLFIPAGNIRKRGFLFSRRKQGGTEIVQCHKMG